MIPLWRDRALGRWMGTLGVPNPDALLVDLGADGVQTLRPVDLKWSVDTADYSQIAGETLRRLVEKGGERLAALLPAPAAQVRLGDGLFAAPDRPLNHLFLRSGANRKREYPIEEREVAWLAVDPEEFFSPLPGWGLAERMAQLDRTRLRAGDLELYERYFHLGAGARGVLLAEQRSVFAEREGAEDAAVLNVDPELEKRALEALDALIVRLGVTSTRTVVAHLQRVHVAQAELRRQLKGLLRLPVRFEELVAEATRLGRRPESEDDVLPLRALYKELGREHAVALRTRGLALVKEGLTDTAALEQVRTEWDDIKRGMRRETRERVSSTIA